MKTENNFAMENVVTAMLGKHYLLEEDLGITIGKFNLRIRSNSAALLETLRSYFSHIVTQPCATAIEIIAVESETVKLNLDFSDWSREPGKRGRKDSIVDLPECRVVYKVRTGMMFLQSSHLRIAAGPCLENDNQLINFINTQYMTWLQQNGWLICHAAGLVYHDKAYAFAGFSGGGKSTLMLHLLNDDKTSYLTNDRLFIKSEQASIIAAGVPKLPRINPGTIVHNPKLHHLISTQQRQEFLAMPVEELWQLEDKYDVFIEDVYGAERILPSAPLAALIILNWQHTSNSRLEVEQVQLTQRQELLDAVMKSLGPFYQYPDGRFYDNATELPKQTYLDVLNNVDIYEVKGGVDFDKLSRYCREEIFG